MAADDSRERPPEGREIPLDQPAETPGERDFFARPEGEAGGAGEPEEPDPELLRIPRRRRRRHPLVGIVVIGLSLYLMWFLRSDMAFFFQPRAPMDVGPVDSALRNGLLRPDTYVRVTGPPDRKNALLLEGRFFGYESFFRLKLSRNRVYVQTHRSDRLAEEEVPSSHAGRVVRFDSLPYRKGLAEHMRRSMTLAHELDFAAIRGPLERRTGRATLLDRQGEEVTLTPDTMVWINAVPRDEWMLQVDRRMRKSEEEAEALAAGLGLPVARDPGESQIFFRFVVLAGPEQARELMTRFRDTGLGVGVVRRQVSYSARWEQLEVRSDRLLILARDPTFPLRYELRDGKLVGSRPREASVTSDEVLYITASKPFEVPADAVVILSSSAPQDHWYYALIYLMLLSFAALNCWMLARRVWRRGEEAAG